MNTSAYPTFSSSSLFYFFPPPIRFSLRFPETNILMQVAIFSILNQRSTINNPHPSSFHPALSVVKKMHKLEQRKG
jgi:hypothetical protein